MVNVATSVAQWYGVPAVSNMEMTLGGLMYTGAAWNV
jgi:nitric oxide synthase oxygenase domain/subunit